MLLRIVSGGLVGVAFGFVLQRMRFCMTDGFRDMCIAKNNTLFYAFLVAITVESVGVLSLIKLEIVSPPYEDYSVLGAIMGSYLSGIGIVLAGGRATGTWYRTAEGLIGSWVVLFFYMLSTASMKYGTLQFLNQAISKYWAVNDNLARQLSISVWYFVLLLVIVTVLLVTRELNKLKKIIATLAPKYKGIRHLLFGKQYHKFWARFIIGLITLIAWPASELTGRTGGLGITTPSANLISYTVTDDVSLPNWGVFLVLGIFLGSYVAARGVGESRWRLPDLKAIGKSAVGGTLMGTGTSWAGGCTIGNGSTATAVISSKGWIALPLTTLGVWTTSYFIFVKPNQYLKGE